MAFDLTLPGLALESLDGRLTQVNDQFARIAGRAGADLVGKTMADLVHPDDRPVEAASRQRLIAGESTAGQVELRIRGDGGDGDRVVVRRSVLSDGSGDARQFVTELLGVTEARSSETRQAAEVVRSNAELLHFASVAAHDLRSPLQVIEGFASLLERVYGPRLDDEGRDMVQWILKSVARLGALVDDLLAYARVGTHGADAVPVDLDAAMRETVSALGADLTRSSASLTWDPLPVVAGDATQVLQLLQNLVANALKFSGDAGPPRVHVEAERDGERYRISVIDNGIGIAVQDRDTVFEMFKRLNPRERYDGTGIGLAICKRIVEGAGGRIWVDGPPEGGCAVRFTLPAAAPATTGPS